MACVAADYDELLTWLAATLDNVGGSNAKIILNVNGGAVEADLVTTANGHDEHGRKVRTEKRTTTHIRIRAKAQQFT